MSTDPNGGGKRGERKKPNWVSRGRGGIPVGGRRWGGSHSFNPTYVGGGGESGGHRYGRKCAGRIYIGKGLGKGGSTVFTKLDQALPRTER